MYILILFCCLIEEQAQVLSLRKARVKFSHLNKHHSGRICPRVVAVKIVTRSIPALLSRYVVMSSPLRTLCRHVCKRFVVMLRKLCRLVCEHFVVMLRKLCRLVCEHFVVMFVNTLSSCL